jgi:hypothetical protein
MRGKMPENSDSSFHMNLPLSSKGYFRSSLSVFYHGSEKVVHMEFQRLVVEETAGISPRCKSELTN